MASILSGEQGEVPATRPASAEASTAHRRELPSLTVDQMDRWLAGIQTMERRAAAHSEVVITDGD